MKKLFIICSLIVSTVLMVGCDSMNTPTKRVEEYLSKYTSLDNVVVTDLDLSAELEGLNTENTELYKSVIKRQYQDMKYEIVNEQINGDDAVVTAKITVYDLYKSSLNADQYLSTNASDFTVNGIYDKNSFMNYKLGKMNTTTETIDYTIDLYLNKLDDKWAVQDLDNTTKEKIHGLYNYEA